VLIVSSWILKRESIPQHGAPLRTSEKTSEASVSWCLHGLGSKAEADFFIRRRVRDSCRELSSLVFFSARLIFPTDSLLRRFYSSEALHSFTKETSPISVTLAPDD